MDFVFIMDMVDPKTWALSLFLGLVGVIVIFCLVLVFGDAIFNFIDRLREKIL